MNKQNIWEVRGFLSFIRDLCDDERLTIRDRMDEIAKIIKEYNSS